MKVVLDIETYWIKDRNGKRVMTLDDYDEGLCHICKDDEGTHEISFLDKSWLLLCPECARLLMNELIEDYDYTDQIAIMRL